MRWRKCETTKRTYCSRCGPRCCDSRVHFLGRCTSSYGVRCVGGYAATRMLGGDYGVDLTQKHESGFRKKTCLCMRMCFRVCVSVFVCMRSNYLHKYSKCMFAVFQNTPGVVRWVLVWSGWGQCLRAAEACERHDGRRQGRGSLHLYTSPAFIWSLVCPPPHSACPPLPASRSVGTVAEGSRRSDRFLSYASQWLSPAGHPFCGAA